MRCLAKSLSKPQAMRGRVERLSFNSSFSREFDGEGVAEEVFV